MRVFECVFVSLEINFSFLLVCHIKSEITINYVNGILRVEKNRMFYEQDEEKKNFHERLRDFHLEL